MNSTTSLLSGHGLYVIASNNDPIEEVEAVLSCGTALLQYREKKDPDPAHALALKKCCLHYNIPFIINDNPRLALEVRASGVHLGESDLAYQKARKILGARAIIGLSCYDSLNQAIAAEKLGANYIAFGSFFPSKTKQNTRHPDLDLLKEAREILTIPIVAIGGITPENGLPLIAAGANYLAAIHGVFGQINPALAAQEYITLFNEEPEE